MEWWYVPVLTAVAGFVLGIAAHPIKVWLDEQTARHRMRSALEGEVAGNLITLGLMRRFCGEFLDNSPASPEAKMRWDIIREQLSKIEFKVYDHYVAADLPRLTSVENYHGFKVAYERLKELASWYAPSGYEEHIGAVQIAVIQISPRIDSFFDWLTAGHVGPRLQRTGRGWQKPPGKPQVVA